MKWFKATGENTNFHKELTAHSPLWDLQALDRLMALLSKELRWMFQIQTFLQVMWPPLRLLTQLSLYITKQHWLLFWVFEGKLFVFPSSPSCQDRRCFGRSWICVFWYFRLEQQGWTRWISSCTWKLVLGLHELEDNWLHGHNTYHSSFDSFLEHHLNAESHLPGWLHI